MYKCLLNVYRVHLILYYSFYTDSVNKFILKFEIPKYILWLYVLWLLLEMWMFTVYVVLMDYLLTLSDCTHNSNEQSYLQSNDLNFTHNQQELSSRKLLKGHRSLTLPLRNVSMQVLLLSLHLQELPQCMHQKYHSM
jgi:hypothetical protein